MSKKQQEQHKLFGGDIELDYADEDAYPPDFNFSQDGEIIEGTVVEIRQIDTQYGESTVLELSTEERGNVSVWCNVVLQGALKRQNVMPSDFIGIRYNGEKAGNFPTPYRDYTLRKSSSTR